MEKQKSRLLAVLLYTILILLFAAYMFPFAIVLLNSLKPLSEIILDPLALPKTVHLSNYLTAWRVLSFPNAIKNTVIITGVSIVLLVLCTAMSSYWIHRHYRGFNRILEKLITGSALIPFATIMLPLVLVIRRTGLINTYAAGILTYIGIGYPLAYLIMRGSVKAIPFEMDEAAEIDGYNSVQIFFKIILPLMRPTVVAVVISDLFWIWNEFQIALIFLNTRKLQTIQLAINSMFGQFSTKWDIALAGLVISLMPIVVVFLLLQKYIVAGIMQGAVKS
jgi:raffinose/stachyose/melibiose transport system permease protein